MPDPKDNIQKLYDVLSKENKYDLPDVSTFTKYMSDEKRVSQLYNVLSKENKYDLPDFDTFKTKIGITNIKGSEPIKLPTKELSPAGLAQEMFKEERPVSESTSNINLIKDVRTKQSLGKIPKFDEQEQETRPLEELRILKLENKKNIKEKAIENSTELALKNNKIQYVKGDINYQKARKNIEDGLEKETLALTYDKIGNPYIVQAYGPLKSGTEAFVKSGKDELSSYQFFGSDIHEKVKYADDLIKDNKIPEGVPIGTLSKTMGFIGESAIDLAKGFVGFSGGALLGSETGPGALLTGAAGAFTLMAPGAFAKGYESEIVKRYKQGIDEFSLTKKDITQQDKEQIMLNALPQGWAAGGTELAKTAVLSFIPGGSKAAGEGLKNAIKQFASHTAENVATFATTSAGGELVKDAVAKARGYNVSIGESLTNALESGGEGAKTALAFGIMNGVISVPKFVKAASLDYLHTIERPKLVSYSMMQEKLGSVPEGSTQKLISQLDRFAEAKKKVPNIIPAEHSSSFAGLMLKKQNLEQMKRGSDPSFHAELDQHIKSVDDKITEMIKSPENPVKHEVNDVTGQTGDGVPRTEEHEQGVVKAYNEDVNHGVPSQLTLPTEEQQLKDINEGNFASFKYKNESEVPEVFKDKISSRGEDNGEPFVRVTVPKILADFYLGETSKPETQKTAELITIGKKYTPTEEEVKLHQEQANPEDRAEVINQTIKEYDASRGGQGAREASIGVPTEILSTIEGEARSLSPEEQQHIIQSIEKLGGRDAADKLFESEGLHEWGESKEVFLARKGC